MTQVQRRTIEKANRTPKSPKKRWRRVLRDGKRIPPWMLGYSWSTTERLSTQQADTLLAWIDCMRAAATPGLRQMSSSIRNCQ